MPTKPHSARRAETRAKGVGWEGGLPRCANETMATQNPVGPGVVEGGRVSTQAKYAPARRQPQMCTGRTGAARRKRPRLLLAAAPRTAMNR
jgi:hypothetical protein